MPYIIVDARQYNRAYSHILLTMVLGMKTTCLPARWLAYFVAAPDPTILLDEISKAHKGDEAQIENTFYKMIYCMKEADSEDQIEQVKGNLPFTWVSLNSSDFLTNHNLYRPIFQ